VTSEEEGAPGPAKTDEARSYLDLFFGHLSCKLLLFTVIKLCIFVFSFVLFHTYSFRDNQLKNKKTNCLLKRRLATLSRGFKWRQLPGSHPPPNPGRPPLLQLAALCCGGRSLPPTSAAVEPYRHLTRRQDPNCRGKRRFEAICANVESDYLFS
jgi:hypothetical protein